MDFTKLNPFVELDRQAARGGNGVFHLSPADRIIGATLTATLTATLDRVAVAEKALEDARSAARSAARRAGTPLAHLFSATKFIPRSTGERWRDEGIEKGNAERDAIFLKVAQSVTNPDPKYAAIGKVMREAMQRGAFDGIGTATPAAAGDPDAEAKEKAAAILAAGERARTDGSHERPAPTGLAKRILDAGEARRRPFGDD